MLFMGFFSRRGFLDYRRMTRQNGLMQNRIETLKEKLGTDFRPYRILGACNPQLALRALLAEPGIGLLLPCNVVVEPGRDGHTLVRFMEPIAALGLVANDQVAAVAREASQKLHRVAQQLGADNRDV